MHCACVRGCVRTRVCNVKAGKFPPPYRTIPSNSLSCLFCLHILDSQVCKIHSKVHKFISSNKNNNKDLRTCFETFGKSPGVPAD